jgi:hypothetical protein
MSAPFFALNLKRKTHWQQHPYTINILSVPPLSVFTSLMCALVLLALVLVFAGLAGIALGPILLWMGWSLLKFTAGMLLLIFLFRVSLRLFQTLWRAVRRTPFVVQFAAQARPWLLLGWMLARLGTRAFVRWYKDQQQGGI